MERMQDLDPVETGEWVDSLRAVLHHQGSVRASYLLERLAEEAGRAGLVQPSTLNTPYVNTIPPEREERANWDRDIEHRIRSIIRWNAVAIILRATRNRPNWAATSRASSRRQPSTTSASGISGTRRQIVTGAISSICRGTPPRASTRAPS
jgi:pyruvate dehydrogenase complex dehydrogenase (E1) component